MLWNDENILEGIWQCTVHGDMPEMQAYGVRKTVECTRKRIVLDTRRDAISVLNNNRECRSLLSTLQRCIRCVKYEFKLSLDRMLYVVSPSAVV